MLARPLLHVVVWLVGFAVLVVGACDRRPTQGPPARESYYGREIAQPMSHLGAGWLTRDSREAEERTSELLRALQLRPGDVACDVGAGVGYHALRMAPLVAPGGKVIAVDIQREMLDGLEAEARKQGIGNVETVLGELWDPKLPEKACDRILLVDVYHELSHPEEMLRAMRGALDDGGTLVLVEFRAEDPAVPIKPLHKMSKEQMLKEIPPNGFVLVEQYDALPWQHVMFFGRAKS